MVDELKGEVGMQTETEAIQKIEEEQSTTPYFGIRDVIFLVVAVTVAISVATLGFDTWKNGQHTETTKSHGEHLLMWMSQQAELREVGKATRITACDRGNTSWAECRDALIAENGPFAGMHNAFQSRDPIFSSQCDRSQLNSQGSVLVQKGIPKPPDGSSLAYSPLPDDEPMSEPLALRISVCGRGFSIIHIGELKF